MKDYSELVKRLRGEYRIPITDGYGPAGGEEPDNPNEFVRRFETPPIQNEAADAITSLTARVAELEDGKIWSRIRSELSNCENLMHVVTEATTYERVSSSLDEIARRCARAALKGGDA